MNNNKKFKISDVESVKNLLHDMQRLVGPVSETPISLSDGRKIKAGLGMEQLAFEIESYVNTINRNITNIVILGEFNRGKTTLLNSLLAREYLPTLGIPNTAAITRITYGDRERITVYYKNARPETISWEIFRTNYQLSNKEIREPALQERFKKVDYIQIETPHPFLKQGVTFVDTPGLGEHWMRSQVTLRYLRQAQVVIFVLDAIQAMSLAERNVIKLIIEKCGLRCFFVVNRINQIDPEDIPEVKEWVQSALRDGFTNSQGDFDEELYQNRVFWVDAKSALPSHQNSTENTKFFEKSGVRALETSLITFLDAEHRQIAVLQSIANNTVFLSAFARQRISALKHILSEPHQQASELLKASAARLETLKRDMVDLDALLSGFAERIKYAIYADILNFISEMKSTWREDGKQLVNENNIQTIWKLLSAERRQEFSKHLEEGIQTYLETKLLEWSERMPSNIAPVIDEIRVGVERKVHELSKGLKESEHYFLGKETTYLSTTEILLSHLMEDLKLKDVSSNIADSQNQYLTKNLKSIVANGVILIASMFLGSGWIVLVISGLVGTTFLQTEIDNESYAGAESASYSNLTLKIQQGLLMRLGKQLFSGLRAEIVKKREDFFLQLDAGLKTLNNDMAGAFNAQIISAKQDIAALELFVNSPESVINSEIQRLELINTELMRVLNELLLVVRNTTITEQGVDAVIHEFSLGSSIHEEYGEPLNKILPPLMPVPSVVNLANSRSPEIKSQLAQQVSERISRFISSPASEEVGFNKEIANISPELFRLVGLSTVKKWVVEWKYFIQEELKLQRFNNKDFPSLHIAFTGNPGTGKTTVARLIGKVYKDLGLIKKGHVHEVAVNDLTSVYVGGTTKAALAQLEEAIDGVLFIDEAYQLVADGINYRGEVVDLLVKYMEDHRDRLVVIVAGYPKEMQKFLDSNPGLRRRFPQDNIIEFPDYNPSELMSILILMLKEQGYSLSNAASEQIGRILDGMYFTRKAGFGNAGTIRDFCLALRKKRNARVGVEKLPSDTPIDIDDIPQSFNNYAFSPAKKPDEILQLLDGFIGMEKLKKQVSVWAKQLMYNKRQNVKNKDRSLHMVFRGNPGTGKTSVAKIMGKILKSLGMLRSDNVETVIGTDLIAGYIGQSGEKTRKVIERSLDGILFIDEAYGLTTIGLGNSDFGASVIQELIVAMEQYRDRLVIIFAGYSLEMYQFIDSNPGLASRIPYQFDFPDYSPAELMQIFEKMVKEEEYFLSEAARSKTHNTITAMHYDRDRYFGNARSIRNLLNEIITQQNARALDLLDLPDGDTLAKRIEIEDIPDYSVTNRSPHRDESMSDVQINIVKKSELALDNLKQETVDEPIKKLSIPFPAADRSY